MREMECYLNAHREITKAVLYAGNELKWNRLQELVVGTHISHITITGDISKSVASRVIQKYLENIGGVNVDIFLDYSEKENIKCQIDKDTVFIFLDLENVTNIFAMCDVMKPSIIFGEMPEQINPSFYVWERLRNFCDYINIVTYRKNAAPQVLAWQKDSTDGIELSIVFPMYNVEKYLEQCISSVTTWKADYVEFIFVNDGSQDGCRDIVLKWAEKDKRIKLLDKKNGGCASARQYGLERAKGRYIGFVDPDDFVDESMFRKLLSAAMTGSYEISYCRYSEYYDDTGTINKKDELLLPVYEEGTVNRDCIDDLMIFSPIAIWRRIYKKSFLQREKIGFYMELRCFDDLPFYMETLAFCKSIVAVNEHLYFYRLEREGQDVSIDDDRLFTHFDIFRYLDKSIGGTKNQKLCDYLLICKVKTHVWALEKIQKKFLKEYVSRAREDLRTSYKSFIRSKLILRRAIGKKNAAFFSAITHGNVRAVERLISCV